MVCLAAAFGSSVFSCAAALCLKAPLFSIINMKEVKKKKPREINRQIKKQHNKTHPSGSQSHFPCAEQNQFHVIFRRNLVKKRDRKRRKTAHLN